ncbi:MAG: prepilin-type N-terminal cleavage/methylation domain-containing protein [Caldisericaceae bacterium]
MSAGIGEIFAHNQPMKYSLTNEGFTLIELIVVVTIIIILSAISIPYLRSFIVSQQLQNVAWQLRQDLSSVKEDAILYQQDLRVYFCTDPSNERNFYLFETYLKDPLNPNGIGAHYTPGDPVDGKHFVRRDLQYKIMFTSHKPFLIKGYINGKQYYYVTFYCGKDAHFRGQPSAIDTIELIEPNTGKQYYVIVDLAGRIRTSGTHP